MLLGRIHFKNLVSINAWTFVFSNGSDFIESLEIQRSVKLSSWKFLQKICPVSTSNQIISQIIHLSWFCQTVCCIVFAFCCASCCLNRLSSIILALHLRPSRHDNRSLSVYPKNKKIRLKQEQNYCLSLIWPLASS